MYEKALNIAYEAALFMEENIPPEITGAHEFYLDFDVNDDGTPFVLVTAMDKKGAAALSSIFGDAVNYSGPEGRNVDVPVIVKEHRMPGRGMN